MADKGTIDTLMENNNLKKNNTKEFIYNIMYINFQVLSPTRQQ